MNTANEHSQYYSFALQNTINLVTLRLRLKLFNLVRSS